MNNIINVNKAVDIISDNILTPIIYMVDTGDNILFICFCDCNMPYIRISDTEEKLTKLFNEKAFIIDIREFSELDRMEILEKADLIYCSDDDIKRMFEIYIVSDATAEYQLKSEAVDRYENCDSAYIN